MNKIRKLIGICIDIRKSTKMVDELGLEKTTELISSFIEKVYSCLQKYESLQKRARHQGDGILITLHTKDDENAFNKVKSFISELSTIILEHTTEYFKVGVGLDYNDSIETRIRNSPSGDYSLVVGNSLSTSVKICSQVPFTFPNSDIYFIKASKKYIDASNWKEDEQINTIHLNSKNTMAFIAFK